MSKFVIKGQKELSGTIPVYGAKNAALKIFPAALLLDGPLIIKNVPDILDIRVMAEIMQDLGAVCEKIDDTTYKIDATGVHKNEISEAYVQKMRASFLFIIPLLTRFGDVKFFQPGGDAIGKRPIDMTIEALQQMGATTQATPVSYEFKLENKRLKGAEIVFKWITHTGTESVIMAAVKAEGTTIIKNAALEPEVVALCEFLNEAGAKISGIGTHTLTIEGVDTLEAKEYTVIPDRIETGTFACMAAITNSEITITDCDPSHLDIFWKYFDLANIPYTIDGNNVTIHKSNKLKAVDVKTHEYPGFITDLQAPFTVLMTQAEGTSLIHETIYEGRMFYTDLLNKMGASIILADPHRAIVQGPRPLYGQTLDSPDIRAGMALILAALGAKGETTIDNIYHIDRGYANIEERLRNLGADITRIQ